jgi:(R)-amidase
MAPTVAACQLTIADLSVETNAERVCDCVAELEDAVDVAVFPEQTLTGFVPDDRIVDAALPRDSEPITDLQSVADRRDTALVVGFVEADGDDRYNATAYLDRDGERTVYRKRHLWGGERKWLTPGEELVTVDTPVGEAGLLTCYDLNFVDDSAALAREEVTALLVVGAWPAAYSENWRLLCRARALDGVRWVVAAGRTGERDVPDARTATYAGRSLVARPDGGVHRALDRQPGTLVAHLDPATLATQRELIGVFSA